MGANKSSNYKKEEDEHTHPQTIKVNLFEQISDACVHLKNRWGVSVTDLEIFITWAKKIGYNSFLEEIL